ncbi:MAG TPA: sortase [Anaerolineae bacterium]|nr:sortase [Anaerolineae bacterium]
MYTDNQPSNNNQNEGQIPIPLVIATIGTLLIITGLLIILFSPVPLPLSQPLRQFVVGMFPATANYLPGMSTPTPILLPETPAIAALPSVATEAEAPRQLPPPPPSQPSRLTIPAINLDTNVVSIGLIEAVYNNETYYLWDVPDAFEAGWHNSSALLGNKGNTVLNGHHNINGEVFRRLIDLNIGDTLTLYDARQNPYEYHITHKEILPERDQPLDVRIENAKWIQPTDDERITLITCWPYTDNSHRLVVVAKPITEIIIPPTSTPRPNQ